MIHNLRKILFTAFSLTLSMTVLPSCTFTSDKKQTFEKVTDTDYSITYYWGPSASEFNEDVVIKMKEAGFDIVPLQRFAYDYEMNKTALDLLKKHGLNAAVTDGRISSLYYDNAPQSRIDTVVAEVVEYYKDYDNIKEWIICDEPSAAKFDVIGRITDAIHRLAPGAKAYVNLLPNYAPADMLGTSSYEEYLNSFCEKVQPDYICFDYYDLLGDDTTVSHRGLYLENHEQARIAGMKYNKENRVIVLLIKHGPYSNVSYTEVVWQSNLSLLFGNKSLSFFTFSLPTEDKNFVWSDAMVEGDGSTTPHYEYVKKANAETRVLGNALYNTEAEKVFCIDNTNTASFTIGIPMYSSYGALADIEGGKDMLVSFYNNGSFLLMNGNSDPDMPSTLTTKSIKGSLQWLNPKTSRWESIHSSPYIKQNRDTTYDITLNSAQAVLLRVAIT